VVRGDLLPGFATSRGISALQLLRGIVEADEAFWESAARRQARPTWHHTEHPAGADEDRRQEPVNGEAPVRPSKGEEDQ